MYKRDMPIIRQHALASPDGLADVVLFALLTIQQPLSRVPESFADVRREGLRSIFLFGAKREGYKYLQQHKKELHKAVTEAVKHRDTISAVELFLPVPSIGLVKAGFIAQMLGLQVGCIDSHNLTRFGLTYNAVRFRKTSVRQSGTRRGKIERYVQLCRQCGGARKLWDDWCKYVADPHGKLNTASVVSYCHVRAMGLQAACPF